MVETIDSKLLPTSLGSEEIVIDFEKLKLKSDLQKGINAYGFEKPSLLQQKAIPALLKGKHLLAEAQKGSGKTASYVISILQIIDEKKSDCQALVLVPTRQMATEVAQVFQGIGKHLKISAMVCLGGTSIAQDIKQLKEGAQIVVGTPGRVYDLLLKSYLSVEKLRMIVLDEMDETLDRGFLEQIGDIFQSVSANAQVVFFTATLSQEIQELANKFMIEPITITLANAEWPLRGVEQYFIAIDKEELKFNTLDELYQNLNITQCVMFCKTTKRVEELANKIKEKKYEVAMITEDMIAEERSQILQKFASGDIRNLVATDLATRICEILSPLVINYDLPETKESYIYRARRHGGYVRGSVINFFTPDDAKFLQEIEKFYDIQIKELPPDVFLKNIARCI